MTRDCLRDLARTVPGRCKFEFEDTVEGFRSGWVSRSLSMTVEHEVLGGLRIEESGYEGSGV